MSYSRRIHGLLETELFRHLTFSFSVTRNRTRPGAPSLELGDRFELTVRVANHSEIPLSGVKGIISSAFVARFNCTPFEVEHLPAGRETVVATIAAEVTSAPEMQFVLDQIGTVSVSAHADLSRFPIRAVHKALVFALPTGSLPSNRRSVGSRRPAVGRRTRSIPLS